MIIPYLSLCSIYSRRLEEEKIIGLVVKCVGPSKHSLLKACVVLADVTGVAGNQSSCMAECYTF